MAQHFTDNAISEMGEPTEVAYRTNDIQISALTLGQAKILLKANLAFNCLRNFLAGMF